MSKTNNQYFNYLLRKLEVPNHLVDICRILHTYAFEYSIPMDENRFADGVELRYRYARDCNVPEFVIVNSIDHSDCTIFEMMAALALRIEEQIMDNPAYGNRVSLWFADMITSLGLDNYEQMSDEQIKIIVFRFLNHEYKPNGAGSLFLTDDPYVDMRTKEIWICAQQYLNQLED